MFSEVLLFKIWKSNGMKIENSSPLVLARFLQWEIDRINLQVLMTTVILLLKDDTIVKSKFLS